MVSNFDYYNFRIQFVKKKIDEEIQFYENHEYHNFYEIKDYMQYLLQRITEKKPSNTVTQYDKLGNKREFQKLNPEEYHKDMDKYVFTRPWKKLKEFHKIMKIKEYVNKLEYHENITSAVVYKNREYLINEIVEGLKNKKFVKNKHEIIYDMDKMEILSISCLQFNKKKKLYEIEWDT
jgi:hypothetical protein